MYFELVKLEHKQIADHFRAGGITDDMPQREEFLRVVERVVKQPLKGFRDWATVWREGDEFVAYNDPNAKVLGAYYPYADEHSCCVTYDGNRVGALTGMIHVWDPETTHTVFRQGPQIEGRERVAVYFTLSS